MHRFSSSSEHGVFERMEESWYGQCIVSKEQPGAEYNRQKLNCQWGVTDHSVNLNVYLKMSY